jgi:rhomboid protease GluP
MIKKLRLFFLPFIVITVGLCIAYTFLNWLLVMNLQLISVDKAITDFGVPFILPWIPILFYFRPRLRTLDLQSDNGRLPDFYKFILWFAMAAPLIVTQYYVEKTSGQLTQLQNINQISELPQTKYYKIKDYYIDKANIGFHPSFSVSGKHNEYFSMQLYVTLPIFEKQADTSNSICSAWLAVVYSDRTSNDYPDSVKERHYNDFAKNSQWRFDTTNFSQFTYLEKLGREESDELYIEASKKSRKYSSSIVAPILLPVNEAFENRAGSSLAWVFGSFGIVAFVWLIMILIPKFDKDELLLFEFGKSSTSGDLKEFVDFLKPKEGYFITPILIYLNVGVFLTTFFCGLGFMTFKAQDLLTWGANFRPITTDGQWWRLLTNTFMHGGIMHLFANMYGLLFVGIFLEPLLGRTRYLIAYLLTGILASCASIWWYDATISIGASGAVFGLYGMFLALLLTRVFTPEFGKAFLLSTLVFVGFNLLMGLKGGIDNAAHIGGLASGFALGLAFRLTLKRRVAAE